MDYPYIEVQARNADGGRVTVALQYTSGDVAVSEADVVAAVQDLMTAAPGVVSVTATRHHITQTPT